MSLAFSMTDLIDHYGEACDKDALRRLWESQAKQRLDVEEKQYGSDHIDHSKALEEVGRYCRSKMTRIDKVLETM